MIHLNYYQERKELMHCPLLYLPKKGVVQKSYHPWSHLDLIHGTKFFLEMSEFFNRVLYSFLFVFWFAFFGAGFFSVSLSRFLVSFGLRDSLLSIWGLPRNLSNASNGEIPSHAHLQWRHFEPHFQHPPLLQSHSPIVPRLVILVTMLSAVER